VTEYESQRKLYEEFADTVKNILSKAIEQSAIKIHSIQSRAKSPQSLIRKIERATPPFTDPLRQVTDLSGVRVITYFPTDLDAVAELVVKSFSVDEENSIDKRKASDPTRFGYSSLHYVVQLDSVRSGQVEYRRFADLKCEIQIRTILQHAWAEIEHDIEYKAEIDIPIEIRRRFAILSGLLELADREFESIRQEEEVIRRRIATSLSEDKLKIPINMVSLQEYLRDKRVGKYAFSDISPRELSDLVADMQDMGVNDIEALNRAMKHFDLDISEIRKNLKVLTSYQADLHPVGVIRIVLARAYPKEFQKAMEAKLMAIKGRIREFNQQMTSEILRLVSR